MFVVQLAESLSPYIGVAQKPSPQLVDLFEKAAFCVASNFTIQVKPEDAKYLYLRYKKIHQRFGLLECVTQPRVSFAMTSLIGYTLPQLMEQYVNKVMEMNIGFDPNASPSKSSSGFVKGPSRLQDNDSDVDFMDSDLAQLVTLIRENALDEIRQLLKTRPELVNWEHEGIYPVHHAADFGRLEVLKLLAESGANLDQTDSSGETVLHYAATNGHSHLISYLLEQRLDPNQKCNEGYSPKDLATDPEILELLDAEANN